MMKKLITFIRDLLNSTYRMIESRKEWFVIEGNALDYFTSDIYKKTCIPWVYKFVGSERNSLVFKILEQCKTGQDFGKAVKLLFETDYYERPRQLKNIMNSVLEGV